MYRELWLFQPARQKRQAHPRDSEMRSERREEAGRREEEEEGEEEEEEIINVVLSNMSNGAMLEGI